jgi:hypothetical protein
LHELQLARATRISNRTTTMKMSSLARISFLQRPRTDQLLSLSRVIHVMQRMLVLKHWHDVRKSKNSGPTDQPVQTLLEEACVESSMLTVRALDAFFTSRPETSGRMLDQDICAEHFGYPQSSGFLNNERREELTYYIGNISMLHSDGAFHASLRADLLRSVKPCRRFLEWILFTDFLDGEDSMRDEAQTLLARLQLVAAEIAAQTLKPATVEVTEDVVKATTASLRAAKSSFGPVFASLVKNAVLVTPAIPGGRRCLGVYGTVTFPCRLEDLDLLLHALAAFQASLGENSESIRILNWLYLSWSELRRKTVTGKVLVMSA